MRLLSFEHDGQTCTGSLLDDATVLNFGHEACGLPAAQSAYDWLNLDSPCHQQARALTEDLQADAGRVASLRDAGAALALESITILAPIQPPRKFICIGLNYKDHAEESGMAVPEQPVIFSKFATAVTGHEAPVFVPVSSQRVDYEAEFAIVIGRRCHRVAVEEARQYVLGYTCVNDVSARDLQEMDGQWVRAKSLDSFGPTGPWIVSQDSIEDPHKLGVRLRLNGETLQDSSTDQLIFGVEELVSFLSQDMTLEPGDLISTGTPPGVGFARKPPIYIKDGDVMEVEIDGIGVLRNPVKK